MNKSYLILVFLLLGLASNAQQLYDDFEDNAPVSYSYTDGVFDQEFLNPDTSGINSSLKCAKYIRNIAVQWDVILMEPKSVMQDLGPYKAGSKQITLDIKCAVATTVQITLESQTKALPSNYPTGRHSVYLATTSGSNEWETLTFEFDQQPDNQVSDTEVDRMVILLNPGSFSNDIYYLDNIYGPEFDDPCQNQTPDSSIADDFDCQRNVSFDFSNGNMSLVKDPIEPSDSLKTTCAKFVKWTTVTDGAFGGSFNYPFSSNEFDLISIDLYDSQKSQDFMVILQDSTGNNITQQTITTSGSADSLQWTNYILNIGDIDSNISIEKFVFLLSPATSTADSIFLDNFRLFKDTISNSSVDSTDSTDLSAAYNGNYFGAESVRIFPSLMGNQENLNIEIDFDYHILTIELYSLEGKRIYQANRFYSDKYNIELNQLEKGMYLIRLIVDGQKHYTQRLFKQ